jgi:membrane-associated protease RseP (regulator of RpoE activity)
MRLWPSRRSRVPREPPDEDRFVVAAARPARPLLAVTLFALTCLSTLFAGALHAGAVDLTRPPVWLLSGVPFAATLLAILGIHELGHYVTARRYRAAVSLPYFIPAPPPFPFGTLGAIIRMRSPVRDRNALLDIAAAGPLAGLVIALPALVLGLAWSTVGPAPDGLYIDVGDSVLTALIRAAIFGPLPEGAFVYTHPVADAGWVGLFVTALNLFPVGQLDGGRIAYAVFGRRHARIGRVVLAGTLALGVVTWLWNLDTTWTAGINWFVWAALVYFLIGVRHGAPLDDWTPLSPGRRRTGLLCLLLFVLLLPPHPLQQLG